MTDDQTPDFDERLFQPAFDVDDENDVDSSTQKPVRYRGAMTDPAFGLLIACAIAAGSMPLVANDADFRYTISWGILIIFSVMAWLFGNFPRIAEEHPEDLAWGIALSLVLGIPLVAFGSGLLFDVTHRVWDDFPLGTVLAYLVFIMPMAETLFFRGIMQENRVFWEVGLIATFWGLVLFFPHINAGPLPLIAGVILAMANILYSYVRMRNGLAAAWMCQIAVNLMIFFFPLV
jgi:membrane protease YdiL (CAAX protease family)